MAITIFVGLSHDDRKTFNLRVDLSLDGCARTRFNRTTFTKAALVDQINLRFDFLNTYVGGAERMRILIKEVWEMELGCPVTLTPAELGEVVEQNERTRAHYLRYSAGRFGIAE